jgi:urease accessory protein
MVIGAVMAMLGVPMPPAEIGIAASVLVLSVCVALSIKAPVWVASLIVATFAVFHGYTHGSELPSAADPIGYSAGFVIATGLLHLLGIAIGSLNRWRRGVVAIRIMGWGIAVAGAWFLTLALNAAIRSGAGVGSAGSPTVLIVLPCLLLLLVAAAWLIKSDRPIVIKIVASWLIAIAVLTATLPFLSVTPGYLPDHME